MTLETTVTSIRQLTPDVTEFVLEAPDHVFEYEPGYHARVRYETNSKKGMARPYTPTTLPGTSEVTLAIKHYENGDASTFMHERAEGDVVPIEPPAGDFTLRDSGTDAVFLATGTGITPMIAMLRRYVKEGTGDAHLVFGERDRDHLIYRELLDEMATDHGNVSVTYSLSDPDEDWDGLTGNVQNHLDDVLSGFDGTDFYVCGVPEMVVDTREALLARGVSADRILTEGWEEGVVQAKAEPLSVYDDVGGMEAIESVVDRMYDFILDDDRLAPYFDESNIESLVSHQSRFIAMCLGGPEYHQHVAETHAHMNLTDEGFDAVLAYLHASLTEHGVDEEYVHGLKSQLQGYRASTVTA